MTQANFMELISARFSAGEVKTYMVQGSYFEVIDAPLPVSVRLTDQYGAVRGAMSQAEASFYLRGSDFSVIEITSLAAQTIRFAFGSAEAGTRRTAGVVQVIDGGKSRTLTQTAFAGYAFAPLLAANNGHAQLWNPIGSGVKVVCEQVKVFSQADFSYVSINNAALSNLGYNGKSKLSGAQDGVSEFRWATLPALLVAPLASVSIFSKDANQNNSWVLSNPIILLPGFGLLVANSTQGLTLGTFFEFYEEPA